MSPTLLIVFAGLGAIDDGGLRVSQLVDLVAVELDGGVDALPFAHRPVARVDGPPSGASRESTRVVRFSPAFAGRVSFGVGGQQLHSLRAEWLSFREGRWLSVEESDGPALRELLLRELGPPSSEHSCGPVWKTARVEVRASIFSLEVNSVSADGLSASAHERSCQVSPLAVHPTFSPPPPPPIDFLALLARVGRAFSRDTLGFPVTESLEFKGAHGSRLWTSTERVRVWKNIRADVLLEVDAEGRISELRLEWEVHQKLPDSTSEPLVLRELTRELGEPNAVEPCGSVWTRPGVILGASRARLTVLPRAVTGRMTSVLPECLVPSGGRPPGVGGEFR